MKATIKVKGATRKDYGLARFLRWQCPVDVTVEGGNAVSTSFAVSQLEPADFQRVEIIPPEGLPEWVCASSVEESIRSFFANQVKEELMPDATLSSSLTVASQIEDSYEASSVPWTYLGTLEVAGP